MLTFCIFAPQKQKEYDIHSYEIPTADRRNRSAL